MQFHSLNILIPLCVSALRVIIFFSLSVNPSLELADFSTDLDKREIPEETTKLKCYATPYTY